MTGSSYDKTLPATILKTAFLVTWYFTTIHVGLLNAQIETKIRKFTKSLTVVFVLFLITQIRINATKLRVYQDNKYYWLFYVYSLLMEVNIEFYKRFS